VHGEAARLGGGDRQHRQRLVMAAEALAMLGVLGSAFLQEGQGPTDRSLDRFRRRCRLLGWQGSRNGQDDDRSRETDPKREHETFLSPVDREAIPLSPLNHRSRSGARSPVAPYRPAWESYTLGARVTSFERVRIDP